LLHTPRQLIAWSVWPGITWSTSPYYTDFDLIEEEDIINSINKELKVFHESQLHTGAPNDIDNTIKQLEAELKIKGDIPFWEEYVKYKIVKEKFVGVFSFDQLWQEIIKFPFERVPDYDKIVDMLYKWLDGDKPFINQRFNEETRQIELVIYEITPA